MESSPWDDQEDHSYYLWSTRDTGLSPIVNTADEVEGSALMPTHVNEGLRI